MKTDLNRIRLTSPQARPVNSVISDQNISARVITHLRLNLSPAYPATGTANANTTKNTVLAMPIWRSVRPSSSWIGIVRSPKRTRSACEKKNASERSPSISHL